MSESRTLLRSAIALTLLALLLPGATTTAGEWTLADALKQIDKATKGVRGLTGDVTVTDQQAGADARSMSGEASIRIDGRIRLEAEGENAKTILCIPGKMFVHEPGKSTVTEYPLAKHPDKLAQYALVGFAPLGTALKKDFLLTLVEDSTLDEKSVLMLELTPKSEGLRGAVSKIHLWIDQSNWLPAQQRIFHGGADTHLTVTYSKLSRNDKLDNQIFAPKWPKGTRKEKP
jgi:outer membrane lipoprotein-sorting protein